MFSTKWPVRAACFGVLMFVAGAAISQESHLTLDDIDKLARAKLVDSMRGPQGGQGGQGGSAAPGNGVGLASPLGAPTPAPVTAAPPAAPKAERRPSAPPTRVIPATFVGAYSDMSGSYVLYDYQLAHLCRLDLRPQPRGRAFSRDADVPDVDERALRDIIDNHPAVVHDAA